VAPLREYVSEGFSEDKVPSEGLSENPVKAEPEFSTKHTKPYPFAIFTFCIYDMANSVNPYEAYAHK